MIETERCRCGARIMPPIMQVAHLEMEEGKDTYIYTCGICGSEIEFKIVADPQRF